MKCPKCSGLLLPDKAKDFYLEFDFLKCLNCGKEVTLSVKEYQFRKDPGKVKR